MTAGRLTSLYENHVGLRHGPMNYLDSNAPVVCLVSSDQTRLRNGSPSRTLRKRLGLRRLIVGEAIPTDVTRPEDVVECRGLKQLGELSDGNAVLVDAVVA